MSNGKKKTYTDSRFNIKRYNNNYYEDCYDVYINSSLLHRGVQFHDLINMFHLIEKTCGKIHDVQQGCKFQSEITVVIRDEDWRR